jgi:hypothetical protein
MIWNLSQLSKRNIFQNSKLILFSDARVSRRNILFSRYIPIHINHVVRLMLRSSYSFEIPAQHSKSPLSVQHTCSASSDSTAGRYQEWLRGDSRSIHFRLVVKINKRPALVARYFFEVSFKKRGVDIRVLAIHGYRESA